MAGTVVESSQGTGTLFAGGVQLGHVPYALTVTVETVHLRDFEGSDERTFDLRAGAGRMVMQAGLLRLDSNDILLKDLLLVLEDGRRARIIIQSGEMRSGTCHFAVRGDIEPGAEAS